MNKEEMEVKLERLFDYHSHLLDKLSNYKAFDGAQLGDLKRKLEYIEKEIEILVLGD